MLSMCCTRLQSLVFEKEYVMKKGFVVIILVAFLCSLLVSLSGCTTTQLGETRAEGHRRHIRNVRLNNRQFNEDLDTALLMQEPSKLTDKTIP